MNEICSQTQKLISLFEKGEFPVVCFSEAIKGKYFCDGYWEGGMIAKVKKIDSRSLNNLRISFDETGFEEHNDIIYYKRCFSKQQIAYIEPLFRLIYPNGDFPEREAEEIPENGVEVLYVPPSYPVFEVISENDSKVLQDKAKELAKHKKWLYDKKERKFYEPEH